MKKQNKAKSEENDTKFKKNNLSLNSYKIIYLRKIENIIFDIILKTYELYLYKIDYIFIDEIKPKCKKNFFPIIIFKEKIKKIKMNIINLLIDYLIFVKIPLIKI